MALMAELKQALSGVKQSKTDRFAALCRELAGGGNPSPESIIEIVEDAGETLDSLEANIVRIEEGTACQA